MKKGFTLIEVMATIVILAVILLIAVPIYNGVRENINESIYKSKIEEILSKAESFASENNAFVFDVKTLIEQGLISADNETGVFMDPRTNRDMKCDILNAIYKENHYEVSITESDVCYDLEELENLYGMVELKLYDKEGREIEKLENTDWLRNEEIHVRYSFKEKYQEYEGLVESLLWTGEQEKSCTIENLNECNEYVVKTEEIKNVVVGLEVRVNMNGASIVNTVRKNILVDLQRPSVIDGSIIINNELSTNNERRVEYEVSDGNGSGVRYTSIVKEKSCNGEEYEKNKQSVSEGIQSIYLGNGDYYICVEDEVGNKTKEEDLEKANNQIHVEGVDQSIPVISKFEVKSTTSSYNALTTNLSILASDDGGSSGLQMCVSNTGYLEGCSWENYSSSKSWKVNDSLDGGVRTIYLSIQDRAGNIVNREAKYTVYKDCTDQTKVYTEANYGTCSKKCGGGLQYRAYQMKDTHTGTVCKTAKDSKTCNTQSCGPYTYDIEGNTLTINYTYTFANVGNRGGGTHGYRIAFSTQHKGFQWDRNKLYVSCRESDTSSRCRTFFNHIGLPDRDTVNINISADYGGSSTITINNPKARIGRWNTFDWRYEYSYADIADKISITYSTKKVLKSEDEFDNFYKWDFTISLKIVVENFNPEVSSGDDPPENFIITNLGVGLVAARNDGEGGDNDRHYMQTVDISAAFEDAYAQLTK